MNHKSSIFTRKRIVLLSVAVLLLIALAIFLCDDRLLVQKYTVEAEQISSPIRLALVTDLHSCKYGEGQSELITALEKQKPDLVLLGGDIFDDVKEDTNTELFLKDIAEKYPCYYVTGNHECWAGQYRFEKQMAILEKYGISILSGETVPLQIDQETLYLCGVDDPDVYMVKTDYERDSEGYISAQASREETFLSTLSSMSDALPRDAFSILLSHRPEYFETYKNYDFDLVLCGHAHGGQWRIPLLLNGLYAPNQGLFPKYAGGRYEAEDMTMIVSRGLARETTIVPRICNRPELVIIDIT